MLRLLLSIVALSACDGMSITPPGVERAWTSEQFAGCTYASPVWITSQGEQYVLAVDQLGLVTALDPETGASAWSFQLPEPGGDQRIELLSTPAIVHERYAVFSWQEIDTTWVRHAHRTAVLDLETRRLSDEFETITMAGTHPTFVPGGTITFDTNWQLQRSALKHVDVSDRELGLVYVTYGNGPDEQPYHGWIFELDMDAWRTGGAGAAIVATLVTTQETDCGPEGSRDITACGGGVWTPAGVLIVQPEPGGEFEMFVPTGNGRMDLDLGGYAYSVLRTQRGLAFDPGCDDALCTDFDGFNPSAACQESCTDLGMIRLLDGDPPVVPEDGSCDGMGFLQCFNTLDYDLGANAPVVVQVPDGPRVIVQAGKDGAIYLFDADHMGTMYQRFVSRDICGTSSDACQAFWAGMYVTQPAVAEVDGEPIVILASLMLDRSHYSGISAYRVAMEGGRPQLLPFWDAPRRDDPEALELFRNHPGRPIVGQLGGEDVVFIVEVRRDDLSGGPPGYLWGVRVRDGEVLVRTPITDSGQRYTIPLIQDDTLYLSTCPPSASSGGRIEAYSLSSEGS